MGALSNKKEDVFVWIKKVLYSCETLQQYVAARNLIKSFTTIYGDSELSELLRLHRVKVWGTLINDQINKK